MFHDRSWGLEPPLDHPDVIILGGSPHTLDLLRIAVLRTDAVMAVLPEPDARVRRFADRFAVDLLDHLPCYEVLATTGALLISTGDIASENRYLRGARRQNIPVHVVNRPLLSDFTLLEFLEQRPFSELAASSARFPDGAFVTILHSINWLYSISGFLVGVLVGITGVGGGSLMTPLLVLLFGIHPATAVGTDLLYAGLTKSVGTVVHSSNRTIDWSITRRLAAGSIPATLISLVTIAMLGKQSDVVTHTITNILGVALLLTAASILLRRWLLAHVAAAVERLTPTQTSGLTVLLGAVLGVLVSLSSVGAGAIGVTVLLMLYPKLPVARLVGSDIAHAVPLTLIAGAGHWAMGSVDWIMLASLLIGSIPGIVIGSHYAARTSDKVLRPVLAGTLAIVGGKLVF